MPGLPGSIQVLFPNADITSVLTFSGVQDLGKKLEEAFLSIQIPVAGS